MAEPIEELRAVAHGMPAAPEEMSGYLAKVRDRAYTVTDADLAALQDAGFSQDQIFEQTVAVAIREGLRRLDRAREIVG
jgi:alkylhydroperoxidase family enzyme